MTATPTSPSSPERPQRRDRTHWLYIGVVVAVVLGIAVGLIFGEDAIALQPLGDGFVALITMMIQPVIFCTIVLGVGSVARAAQVGKVGGLALVYFLVMSTFALTIGLIVGNLVKPGAGLEISRVPGVGGPSRGGGQRQHGRLLLGVIPDSLFSSLTSGDILQTLFVALLVGFAVQAMGTTGKPVLVVVEYLQRVVFRVLAMILWAAPVGAFGAMAAFVGRRRRRGHREPREGDAGVLRDLRAVRVRRARPAAEDGGGHQHLLAVQVPRPGVPADPRDVLLGVGAAAADRQDGARRHRQDDGRHRGADRLLLQPRRHRDLPDHGLAVHRRGARRPAEHRRADLAPGLHGHRLQGRRRRDGCRPRHARRRTVVAPPRAAATASASSSASTGSCPRRGR